VTPTGYLHSRCFEEVAISLKEAFAALGFEVPIVTDAAAVEGIGVVLGANLLPDVQAPLPKSLILYNLEQVQNDSIWLNGKYLELLKRYPVWDYSERNIAALKSMGITQVALCGIGYMPGLTRIAPAAKDIDVLFLGSVNERRRQVFDQIKAQGKTVLTPFGCYGAERDAFIARAKILLNLHFYEAQVFEIVRVSYLLANKCCVVSESGQDTALESALKGAVALVPYDRLAQACLTLLEDDARRAQVAQAGFDCFSRISQVPMLKRALEITLAGVYL
jgi:hypothetical protein